MSNQLPPSPPHTPVHDHQYLQPSPEKSTASANISPSSFMSVSTANTTGTAVHHKNAQVTSDEKVEERDVFRENGTDTGSRESSSYSAAPDTDASRKSADTDRMLIANDNRHGRMTDVTQDAPNASPHTADPKPRHKQTFSEAERIIQAAFNPELHTVKPSGKGYEQGFYVTKLGTEAQEKEIEDGLKKAQKKQSGWLHRMFGRKKE